MTGDTSLRALTDAIEAVSSRYAERFGIRRDVEWCLLKLAEELGELTQVHLKRVGQARGEGDAAEWTRRFEDEMADVLGQLLVLAKLSGAQISARPWTESGYAGTTRPQTNKSSEIQLKWQPKRIRRTVTRRLPRSS